jgi:hypothetical protein
MNEELLQKAMQFFNGETAEKWNAFCELMNKNGEIQHSWWRKLQTEVYQKELQDGNPNWDIFTYNSWDMKWFLRGENENCGIFSSLVIHFHAHQQATLQIYCGGLNINKVRKQFEDPKFDVIRTCIRIDGHHDHTIGREFGNFEFGTPYDMRFPDSRTLSWYAGNKTEDFANQLIAKVRKFQTPEITELFREINKTCRK